MTATVHVCRDCGGRDAVRRQHGEHGSETMLSLLTALLRGHKQAHALRVIPQSCLGPCGPGVRVAVTAPGRWGWLFQGLQPGEDLDAFAEFLTAWLASPEGTLTKAQRPARLLRRTVGRLPPS